MSDEKEKEQSELPVIRPPTLIEKQKVGAPTEPKIGPGVDVNSDITPITRQKIKQIDAWNWDNMNLTQLHQQLSILEQRMLYAQQYSHADIVTQMDRGINQLRILIYEKTPDEIKLI